MPPEPTNPVLDAARAYVARGWRVVPIPPRTKAPLVKGWLQLRLEGDALERAFAPDSNIGLILGEPSGWLVDVDLDSREARDLADTFLPHTDAVSGRDGSPASHRWYVAQGAVTARHSFENRTAIVELRSTGAQTVVHPSIHPSGDQYGPILGEPAIVDAAALHEAVARLADAARELRGEPPAAPFDAAPSAPAAGPADPAIRCGTGIPVVRTVGDVERRAIAYLQALPPSISGAGGHACAYRAATALVHGFDIGPERAMQLLRDHFNPRCQPPWSEKELQHKVDDAASKSHAHPRGYLKDAERAQRQLARTADLSGILGQAGRSRQEAQGEAGATEGHEPGLEDSGGSEADPGPFPRHLLRVPGFISRVMAFDLATAPTPQPILALAGAIALQAVLCGRKVRDRRGNRTNLQLVGVAPSGAGKDAARKVIKRVLAESGLNALEGNEEVSSDAAIYSALEISPSSIFLLDEIGRFMRLAANDRANPHLYAVVGALLKLYSSAGISMKAKGYADATRNKSIDQPCCVVYGTTVPEHLFDSLTVDSLRDGFVGRLFIFEADGLGTYNDEHEERPVPADIVEEAKWWGDFNPTGKNLASLHPEPLLVETTPGADAQFKALRSLADGKPDGLGRALWARAAQKAQQLALVYACSADMSAPVIDGAAAEWACELSAWLTRRMIFLADSWVADGEFDRDQKRVMRFVRDRGGEVTRNQLTRHLQRMQPRRRAEVIDNLLETGQLQCFEDGTDKNPRTMYGLPSVIRNRTKKED